MINTFIITDIAADDISEIIAYISEDSLDNARAMVDRIDAAMHKLAKLLGIGDAIMISKRPDGALQWETWKDRAPGFSAPKQYRNQTPEEMLEGIAPPRKIEEPKPPPFKPPIVVEKAWYEERWVQASAAATVVGAIIGTIFLVRRDQPITVDHNIQSGM